MAASSASRIHVTFSAAARFGVAQALEQLGRKDEEVLALVDDLGYGPIDPGTLEERNQWIDDELGLEPDPWRAERIPAFWDRVTTTQVPIVAWLSTRCVDEYCGLLELLWRAPDAQVSLVDVADIAEDLAVVRSDVLVEKKAIERIAPVTDDARARHRAEWQRLRAENAPLRVMTPEGVLVSAPITHFDETILSFVTPEWQTCARVIAGAIAKLAEGRYRQPDSDDLLFARLLALTDGDLVEGQNDGEYWTLRSSRVRRRAAPAPATTP